MMKKNTIILAVLALVFVGCHHEKEQIKDFKTTQISDSQCYEQTFEEAIGPWGNVINEKISFSVVWPEDGLLTPEAQRELLYRYFGDSSSVDFNAISKRWLEKTGLYDEDCTSKRKIDSIDESQEYSYFNLESSCTQDSDLATILVKTECFGIGAAHGLYSAEYVTVDVSKGTIIHLSDLVTDTMLLREAIARAVQDLVVNKEVNDCLFDEWRDAESMPMPRDFYIDSTRSTIVVSYSLYEVAPYACGIQSVVLPIFWLSKHVPLTPYAKDIFGPDNF